MVLSRKESDTVEFKLSFDREAAESLCAFANVRGGTVYIGIDDKGKRHGITLGKETVQNWINQVKLSTSPSLVPDAETSTTSRKTVVSLSVPEYPVKPVSCRGRYYKRTGTSNHVLSAGEVVNLHLACVNSSWDFQIDPRHSLADIDLEIVSRFIDTINRYRETPITDGPLEVLRRFELVRGENITLGCHLLFSSGPSLLRTVELGRFQTETVIKDTGRLKSDLFSQIEETMAFVKKHINKRIEITGEPQREEIWDYPLDAVREVVINAIVHRDYTQSADTVIKIYDDRIEVYNPGGLPHGVTVKDLLADTYVSRPRNKQIADTFKAAGVIEKYGAGIRRIRRECEAAGLPEPSFKEAFDGFLVTVFGTPQKTPHITPQKTPQKSALGDRIAREIARDPTVTRKVLSQRLGLSDHTVKEYLAKLKAQGRLRRKGSDRAGEWVVRETRRRYGPKPPRKKAKSRLSSKVSR